jgi:phosphopantetheinyl transferase
MVSERVMMTLSCGAAFAACGALEEAPALPPTAAEQANAPSAAPERARFFQRRAFARHMLARQLGEDPATVEIAHHAAGAPFIVGKPDLRLSLTSRGPMAGLALARQPVGVDLEWIEPAEPAWSLLHADEAQALRAISSATRRALVFTQIWTAKEAALKAQGVGLARDPASFAIVAQDDSCTDDSCPGDFCPDGCWRCGAGSGLLSGAGVWRAISVAGGQMLLAVFAASAG